MPHEGGPSGDPVVAPDTIEFSQLEAVALWEVLEEASLPAEFEERVNELVSILERRLMPRFPPDGQVADVEGRTGGYIFATKFWGRGGWEIGVVWPDGQQLWHRLEDLRALPPETT